MARQCERLIPGRGVVRCELWTACHAARRCLCGAGEIPLPWEADPSLQVPPSGDKKHERTARLEWPDRRKQIIRLMEHHGPLTSLDLAFLLEAATDTTRKWLARLCKEKTIKPLNSRKPRDYIRYELVERT